MPTIQDVIDALRDSVGPAYPEPTVDVIKTGDATDPVRGIVTSFMSTWEVCKQAVALDANYIITHEPTFFSHEDQQDWLADDPVFQAKKAYIDAHRLTIWRYHDGWHAHKPDGINAGLVEQLGWKVYQDSEVQYLIHHPGITLAELAAEVKEKIQTPLVRYAGDPQLVCRRIVLVPGAEDGELHIRSFNMAQADVLICGEEPEWQTPEYVRDARTGGIARGLIVAGHERTEEAGMGVLADWLKERYPSIPVTHIASGDPFQTV